MQIPYGKQNINEEDIEAVNLVLRSEYLTQGPVVPTFERAIASYCKTQFAVAMNSATSALHLACLALGVGPGDTVWTSAITFAASANCARYCGAEVDFVDIDKDTFNMSLEDLDRKLREAAKQNRLPKVVIPVHLGGLSCDMKRLSEITQPYGIKIIEDASHAIGGTFDGVPIGSCRYSDVTIFSFHPVKIITTGEGGIATTNEAGLAKKMANLRSHGITRDGDDFVNKSPGPWYYEQQGLGFNYRMTDMAAALGLSQFKKLDQFVAERNLIAENYYQLFKDSGLEFQAQIQDVYSSFHLFVVRPNYESLGTTQKDMFEKLRGNGILANLHYIPVYRHPYYQELGYSHGDYLQAELYYRQAISIPIYPGLTIDQQQYVVDIILKPLGHQTIF